MVTGAQRRGRKRKEEEEEEGEEGRGGGRERRTLSPETKGENLSWQREETKKGGQGKIELKRVGVGMAAWGRQPQPSAPLPGGQAVFPGTAQPWLME